MSRVRAFGVACGLLLALLAGGPALGAEGYCANGAVNGITGNHGGQQDTEGSFTDLSVKCEICVIVRTWTQEGESGSWQEVARICDIWSDAAAHDVMFRIGQCGVIIPKFEQVGEYLSWNTPMRIEAVRLPPCQ